ncbi:YkgJ family cysteine cluster protein [Rubritalea tangerina]|uniref:YkgJ family cysteine cluster protein n=1 Tax=Rubritalea tangerina TaxID=430798 RepID=A0ABW4ZEB2_9BACT
MNADVWYQCDRCLACCKWPGDVKVEADEVDAIAAHLGMEVDVFIEKFTRLRTNRSGLSLIEKGNHECIMLEDGGCKIQAVKPFQCKGFPNRWNFPGWQKVCQAKPVPMADALALGLVDAGELSANKDVRGSELA